MTPNLTILCGDVIDKLRELPDESVHCCVTSPPYWGLRDYATEGQLGLEKTPEEYVAKMVEVFREVRRVLRKDGTLWLNLGDSYAGGGNNRGNNSPLFDKQASNFGATGQVGIRDVPDGLKPKDLVGIPWRVAFALQADGWWLRSDIIWAKPNPMPESVTDRPTKSHEYLFLLTKSANYFYDAEAIKEGAEQSRNKRSVWTVATAPYPEAHFATYPPDLVKPCILAGTSAKGCCAKCGSYRNETKTIGWQPTCECWLLNILPSPNSDPVITPCTVLDPFAGSGTTGAVALELGRSAILIELNPKYVELIRRRCNVTPGLALA